jgi:hypothetical protein
MNNKILKTGNVDIHEDDINELLRLKRNVKRVPCSGKALLDFKDSILKMAADIAIVSEPSKKTLLKEIEILVNGLIYGLFSYECTDMIEKMEREKQDDNRSSKKQQVG